MSHSSVPLDLSDAARRAPRAARDGGRVVRCDKKIPLAPPSFARVRAGARPSRALIRDVARRARTTHRMSEHTVYADVSVARECASRCPSDREFQTTRGLFARASPNVVRFTLYTWSRMILQCVSRDRQKVTSTRDLAAPRTRRASLFIVPRAAVSHGPFRRFVTRDRG